MTKKTISRICGAGALMAALSFFWSTQIVAGWLGHDPRLGGITFSGILTTPIYLPWQIYGWAIVSAAWPGALIGGLAWNAISATFAIGAGACSVYLYTFNAPPKFGASGWGTVEDAIGARLIAGKGGSPSKSKESRVIGLLDGKILTIRDERTFLGLGPPGGGKSRTFFIPSLLDWEESVISYSSGAEDVWNATAGWRATFSDVYFLDFGNPHGHRYNPLCEVRIGTDHEVRDAVLIAELFPPQSPEEAKVPWWPIGGSEALAAVILHICYTKPLSERNFGTIYKFVSMPHEKVINELKNSPNRYARNTGELLGTQKEFIDSVRFYLRPWASPIIAKVTSESDFRASDIVANERPVSLYIRVPSDESAALMDALRVVISTLMRAMMHNEFKTSDGRTKRHKLLMPLDEFHKFKVRDFGGIIQEGRKFGLRFILGTPSEKALYDVYGRNQAIIDACHIQAVMATNDPDTQRRVSKAVGTTTEYRVHTSKATEGDELFARHTRSTVESTRPIIDEGGVRSLPDDEMILLISGHKALRANKLINFDQHQYFAERTKIKPPERNIERRRERATKNTLEGAKL